MVNKALSKALFPEGYLVGGRLTSQKKICVSPRGERLWHLKDGVFLEQKVRRRGSNFKSTIFQL